MRDRLPLIFSITALLVAVLGSTPVGKAAYDAVVPQNSVGTAQLQRNAVKAAKIAPNAVRAGHVLDGTLLVDDFKAGQIPQGPKGGKGDNGAKGDKGDTGNPGTARAWAAVDGSSGAVTAGSNVQSVTRFSTGSYCVILRGIDASVVAPVVSPRGSLIDRAYAHAFAGGCTVAGAGSGVQVDIWGSTNALVDASFYVVVP